MDEYVETQIKVCEILLQIVVGTFLEKYIRLPLLARKKKHPNSGAVGN